MCVFNSKDFTDPLEGKYRCIKVRNDRTDELVEVLL